VTLTTIYRAITLSNSISKILESLLFDIIIKDDDIDEYQLGFRKSVSIAFCTHVFKNTVDYYRRNNSRVFCCFIDFGKAFDRVDYWLLISNLALRCCSFIGVLVTAIKVMVPWQCIFVRLVDDFC